MLRRCRENALQRRFIAARDFFVGEFVSFFFAHLDERAMPSQPDAEFEDIDPEFYELVGRIACDWAALEMKINDCIWALSGTSFGAGACVTSQIHSIDSRMKALAALLTLKGATELATKINGYGANVLRKASDKRNRAVHDIWFSDDHGNAKQLIITADRKLRLHIIARTKEDLRKDHNIVEDALFDFFAICDEIEGSLHTWPDTRPLAIHSRYKRHDQK
jgi:hypothetical protein